MEIELLKKRIGELENKIKEMEKSFIFQFQNETAMKEKLKLPQLRFSTNKAVGSENVIWDTTDPGQNQVEVLEVPDYWAEVIFDPPAPITRRVFIPLWRANYGEF